MRRSLLATLSVLSSVLALATPHAATRDWPHLRGPGLDGRVEAGVFDGDGVGLEPAWKSDIGPGYSGIAVASGRAVTLFSDGESDVVAAFDAAAGTELWRHRLGPTYKGHDGSDDGPLSSPVIEDGTVYAVGPLGELVALRLSDGKPIWTKHLERDFGGKPPHFGFTTTPLVEGDLLIVLAGGQGKAITALDRATGAVRWTLGEDTIDYQSPAAMTLDGRRQIVTVSGKRILGLLPRTGELLWEHALGENDDAGSAVPTWAGENRFALLLGDVAVFGARRDGDTWKVSELYRTPELGGTYALPVYHDGHLYGFRRQFLTAVDAATGEAKWKSRPPGGRGLILVDDHLVVYGAEGHVAIVEATPVAYREVAKLQLLEGSGYTWPSFADGLVYVRNQQALAAARVTDSTGRAAEEPRHPGDHMLARFAAETEAAPEPDRRGRVDELLQRHETFPILDGSWVHFVWRGTAEDVAIAGTMIPSGHPEPLRQVAGTDLYYRSYELPPSGRWEYRYIVDFDEDTPDPRNPRRVPGGFGDQELSEVTTAGYRAPDHQAEPTAGQPTGRLEELTFKSELLGNERKVTVYLPAGYEASTERYPLLVVQQGSDWIAKGRMTRTLDNLVGKSVAPLVVAFVDHSPEWWLEGGGSGTEAFAQMLATELVPHLESKYRLKQEPASRAVMGKTYFGTTAALTALRHPGVFGKAAVQSVGLGLGSEDELFELIEAGRGRDVRFYVDWNRWEAVSVDNDVDFGRDSRELARALERAGYRVAGGEAIDSFGWGSLRARLDRVLEALFPAEG